MQKHTPDLMALFSLTVNFETLDHKQISEYVIRHAPDVFLAAVEATSAKKTAEDAWLRKVFATVRTAFLSQNMTQRVEVIKLIREQKGFALLEAVNVVKMIEGRHDEVGKMTKRSEELYHDIISAVS
jgi:ribosomal protein L7/L12